MTVEEFIKQLEQLDQDTVVLVGQYNARLGCMERLRPPSLDAKIFVDPDMNDATDQERERDILAVVIT